MQRFCCAVLAIFFGTPVFAKEDEQLKRDIDTAVEILVTGRLLEDGVPEVPMDSIGSRDVFGPERVRETGAREVNDLVQHIESMQPFQHGRGIQRSSRAATGCGQQDDPFSSLVK